MQNTFVSLFFTLFILCTSCTDSQDIIHDIIYCSDGSEQITGAGPVVTKELAIGFFNEVVNLQQIDVNISHGNELKVTATGQENLIDRIKTNILDNQWVIRMENGCYEDFSMTIDIIMPNLQGITLKSSGDMSLDGFAHIDQFDMVMMGSGDIIGDDNVGTIKDLDIIHLGSGDIKIYPIQLEYCEIVSSGSGSSYLNVTDNLHVAISGSGDVNYKGYPEIDKVITGSGDLINDN